MTMLTFLSTNFKQKPNFSEDGITKALQISIFAQIMTKYYFFQSNFILAF